LAPEVKRDCFLKPIILPSQLEDVMRSNPISDALETGKIESIKAWWQLTTIIFLIFFVEEPLRITAWYL